MAIQVGSRGWPEKDDLLDSETALTTLQEGDVGHAEETMVELKQLKAQAKTVFTKSRRTLLVTVQQEKVSTFEIKEACEALDIAQEEAMYAMTRLLNKYIAEKDHKSSEKLSLEIEKIEIEYSDAQNRAQQVYDEVSRAASYDKFVRKLDYGSQRQQIETSDVVRSKYEQALSSDGNKIFHQPVSLQKNATENSDIHRVTQCGKALFSGL